MTPAVRRRFWARSSQHLLAICGAAGLRSAAAAAAAAAAAGVDKNMLALAFILGGGLLLWAVFTGRSANVWKALFGALPGSAVAGTGTTTSGGGGGPGFQGPPILG